MDTTTPKTPDASEAAQQRREAFDAAVAIRRASKPAPTHPLAPTPLHPAPRVTTIRATR